MVSAYLANPLSAQHASQLALPAREYAVGETVLLQLEVAVRGLMFGVVERIHTLDSGSDGGVPVNLDEQIEAMVDQKLAGVSTTVTTLVGQAVPPMVSSAMAAQIPNAVEGYLDAHPPVDVAAQINSAATAAITTTLNGLDADVATRVNTGLSGAVPGMVESYLGAHPVAALTPGVPFINVKDFNAVGDGVADDGGRIQEALTTARDAGGGWVYVPEGTYRLATLPLRIYRGTRLTLAPGAKLVRASTGRMLTNGDSGQTFGGYTGHGNIVIEGGTWDMKGATLTTYAMCMSLGHAENITIRDLTILDVPGFHALEVNACRSVKITGCRFLGFRHTGDRGFSEAVQIDLAKGSSFFGAFGPYDQTACLDVVMTGCRVGPSGTSGTTSWPRGFGSHAATKGIWHERIKVTGNTFEATQSWAISGYNYNDVVIADNVLALCRAGIQAMTIREADANDTLDASGVQTSQSQDMYRWVISGNAITCTEATGSDHGIYLNGQASGQVRRALVAGNTITGTANDKTGIRAWYTVESEISQNVLHDAGSDGIQVDTGSYDIVVAGNFVKSSAGNGIWVANASDVIISGNRVRNSRSRGIAVLSTSDGVVAGNNIKGSGLAVDNSYAHLQVDGGGLLVYGNVVRPFGSGNEARYGIDVSGIGTSSRHYGNLATGAGVTADIYTLPGVGDPTADDT